MKEMYKFRRVLCTAILLGLSVFFVGCTPSEDEVYDTLDSLNGMRNYSMEATMDISSWGIVGQLEEIVEVDSPNYHISISGEALGREEGVEFYSDGQSNYYYYDGKWESGSVDEFHATEYSYDLFDSWDIDSIEKTDGGFVVKGTVDTSLQNIDEDLEVAELDFKMKMDKKHDITSITLKGENISSELKSVRIKLYDIDETDVDFSAVEREK